MKKLFITIFFILNTYISNVQSRDSLQVNNLEFEWGNNIFGNTISLGYKLNFNNYLGLGISFGKGYFSYNVGDKGYFLNFNNLPGKDNSFSIELKQIIKLKLSYRLKNQLGIKFFNLYELGLASVHFLFRDEYKDENLEGKFVGEKNYDIYSLNIYFNFIDYKPSKKRNISFLLGLNNYLSLLSTPQTITYYNGTYFPRESELTSTNGKVLLFYPELSIRVIYFF